MVKNVVIVESPAKAKTINKFLGSDYSVIASYGHIRDLPAKNGSVDTDNNFKMTYELSLNSKKYIDKIVSEVKGATSILLATDPDREGEAIAWHVVEVLKQKKVISAKMPIKRVVFSEITKKAIINAVENPRELDINLIQAQQARRALDYLVGFTLSPILWRKLPGSRSAGRVQSVTLKLIAQRDDEIEKFITREYWSVFSDFLSKENKTFKASLTHVNNKRLDKFDLNNEKSAKEIVEELKVRSYAVTKVEKKPISRKPSPPFITSTLQQEASRKLGFPTKKTMKIAQELYEGVNINGETFGLITYMRTDGVSLSKEAVDKARSYVESKYGAEYIPEAPIIYKSKSLNAQEAHEAIRPTDVSKSPKDIESFLSLDQMKLYDLIWKRTLACQMSSSKSEATSVDISSNDSKYTLRANGTVLLFDGFYKVYKESKDDEQDDEEKLLPKLNQGDKVDPQEFIASQHFTDPPPRYTEASLVKKMEELGIGRPSTYAAIISVIQDRNYVSLHKKRFFCEDRGRVVTAFLNIYFDKYVEYNFTAELENKLDEVSSGNRDKESLLSEFWTNFIQNIEEVKLKSNQEVIELLNNDLEKHFFPPKEGEENNRACPNCESGKLSIKPGKFGIFIACGNYPECTYTRQISENKDGEEQEAPVEDENLGLDPQTGNDVFLKKGPYGHYVQVEVKGKPKRMSIPKGTELSDVNLQLALSLLSLPREIGEHPETKQVIKAGFGRYGPFLHYNGKYVSLPSPDNVLTIILDRAIEVINNQGAVKSSSGRVIGNHPKTEDEIKVMSGKFGPYLKHGKKNIPLPKDIDTDSVELEQAVAIIDAYKPKK